MTATSNGQQDWLLLDYQLCQTPRRIPFSNVVLIDTLYPGSTPPCCIAGRCAGHGLRTQLIEQTTGSCVYCSTPKSYTPCTGTAAGTAAWLVVMVLAQLYCFAQPLLVLLLRHVLQESFCDKHIHIRPSQSL